ncbi:hypothetical protein T4A_10876 [Trichinella pseudospiralis]|uniref:Uncharacterized protein n=1 Tax=Trichinella pseudospiralis TaxID=6337 RepID=A0A0V1E1T5_TRIPS|nr:hypothetical protein T4A_10876 [Trichinella pseudospiralis]
MNTDEDPQAAVFKMALNVGFVEQAEQAWLFHIWDYQRHRQEKKETKLTRQRSEATLRAANACAETIFRHFDANSNSLKKKIKQNQFSHATVNEAKQQWLLIVRQTLYQLFSHAMRNQKYETLNSTSHNINNDDDDSLEILPSIVQYEFGNPFYSKVQSTDITVYMYWLWMPVLKMSLCSKKGQTVSTIAGEDALFACFPHSACVPDALNSNGARSRVLSSTHPNSVLSGTACCTTTNRPIKHLRTSLYIR